MQIQTQNTPTLFSGVIKYSEASFYLQKPYLSSIFSISDQHLNMVKLYLTDSHILMHKQYNSQSQNSFNQVKQVFILKIQFNVKFQVLHFQNQTQLQKTGIKIFKDSNHFSCFYNTNPSVLNKWIQILTRKINQKGFHQSFKPLKKLGKGNFATVYQVERVKDGKRFAVKAFSKNACFNAKNGKQSLINQINIMRQLSHQNLIYMQGVYQSDNSIYVVIQLLSGGQFFQHIQKKNRKFTSIEIKEFMHGMLKGLHSLHSKRIMHRDLKPENIMLRNKNSMSPVIVDFGLSAFSDANQYLFFRCGTPGYVAPEIIRLAQSKHIDPQCDIFSLGVIFHILLTGKHLFEGSKYQQVYQKNKLMKVDFQKPEYKTLNRQAFILMRKMLHEDPNKRIKASQALNDQFFKQLQTRIQLETNDNDFER